MRMGSLQDLFNKAKKSAELQSKEREEFSQNRGKNEAFIDFKPGNTYQFRLLFMVQDGFNRTNPFIMKYSHSFWDDIEKESHWVTCPTSEYLDDMRGFKNCPICEKLSTFYKEAEKGSGTARELYDQFKRRFNGYCPVYVIKDPVKPANDGTVKIFRFGKTLAKFLKAEIFGIIDTSKTRDDEESTCESSGEEIGIDAFDPNDGYDFIITVSLKTTKDKITGKESKFNNYSAKFSRKKSPINVSSKDLKSMFDELNFDKEFYTKNTVEELKEYTLKWVLGEDVKSTTKTDSKPLEKMAKKTSKVNDIAKSTMEDEIPFVEDKPDAHNLNKDAKPSNVSGLVDELSNVTTEENSEDIDIDALLDGIN